MEKIAFITGANRGLGLETAIELAKKGVRVIMGTGWVKTDMGSSNAPLALADGIKTSVELALLPDTGPNGQFYIWAKHCLGR
ncbi:MAG: SDR family NAD(P)-dependent oxidoreductase [Gammaproteobacteria bacterium]